MRLEDGVFVLNNKNLKEDIFVDGEGMFRYRECDIVRNFFLAKTEVLIENPWDDELKVAEHEDFFIRLKQNTFYKVVWTPDIQAKYIGIREGKYDQYRRRMYGEFRKKLLEKWNLKGWVRYEKK